MWNDSTLCFACRPDTLTGHSLAMKVHSLAMKVHSLAMKVEVGNSTMKSSPRLSYGLLQALHGREHHLLKRFFLRRAPDLQSDCDDLVQEVYLRILQRKEGEEIEHPRGYVFRTASNVLADLRRRRAVRQADAHVEIEEAGEPADEVSSPERILISKHEIEQVGAALNELNEKVRVAFVLHRFEDLTYNEIATRMNVSVSSVEKYIMQALVHLADRIERER